MFGTATRCCMGDAEHELILYVVLCGVLRGLSPADKGKQMHAHYTLRNNAHIHFPASFGHRAVYWFVHLSLKPLTCAVSHFYTPACTRPHTDCPKEIVDLIGAATIREITATISERDTCSRTDNRVPIQFSYQRDGKQYTFWAKHSCYCNDKGMPTDVPRPGLDVYLRLSDNGVYGKCNSDADCKGCVAPPYGKCVTHASGHKDCRAVDSTALALCQTSFSIPGWEWSAGWLQKCFPKATVTCTKVDRQVDEGAVEDGACPKEALLPPRSDALQARTEVCSK